MNYCQRYSLIILCLAQSDFLSASFFGDNGCSDRSFPSYHSSNPFDDGSQYNLHQQLSLNTEENTVDPVGQTESLTFYSSDDEAESHDESVVRSDATALSDATIYCSGGGDAPAFFSTTVLQQKSACSSAQYDNIPSNSTRNGESLLYSQFAPYFADRTHEETDDETDDEEDDDGDDGANLMLANVSLRRRSSATKAYFLSRSHANDIDSSLYTSVRTILPFGSWRQNKSSGM